MKATFVSIWDDRVEVKSICEFNPETRVVSEIQVVETALENLGVLIEEYIKMPDGSLIRDFLHDGDERVLQDDVLGVNGIMVYQPSFESPVVREQLRSFEYYTSKGQATKDWPGVEIIGYDVDTLDAPYLIDKNVR